MNYCDCNKGFEVLKPRPFLHVRVVEPGRKSPTYLRDENMLVITNPKRSWNLRYGGKAGAYIFHTLAEAKRAAKVPVVKLWLKNEPGTRVEVSCRHCDGVVCGRRAC